MAAAGTVSGQRQSIVKHSITTAAAQKTSQHHKIGIGVYSRIKSNVVCTIYIAAAYTWLLRTLSGDRDGFAKIVFLLIATQSHSQHVGFSVKRVARSRSDREHLYYNPTTSMRLFGDSFTCRRIIVSPQQQLKIVHSTQNSASGELSQLCAPSNALLMLLFGAHGCCERFFLRVAGSAGDLV